MITSYLYKNFAKPLFFKFDPEFVHDKMTDFGEFLGSGEMLRDLTRAVFRYENKSLQQKILGIKFDNPIGLSAGFDKDGRLVNIMEDVGFGYEEVGTVTLNPYEGNPKPRLHRLPKDRALVVYYGLKNDGVERIMKRLKARTSKFPLAISIGKTNADYTKTDKAGIKDYVECLNKVVDSKQGNFYVLNISCPNTFGGEPFTTSKKLSALLEEVSKVRVTKPIFVKMPINIPWEEFDGLLKICVKYKTSGVIIGNLNKNFKKPKHMQGGVSGKPTEKLSNFLISETYKKYKNKLIIIGVGGVFSAGDAYKKIKLGASLVSLITGMIYEGPQLIGQINRDLVSLLKKDGYKSISEAIGAGV